MKSYKAETWSRADKFLRVEIEDYEDGIPEKGETISVEDGYYEVVQSPDAPPTYRLTLLLKKVPSPLEAFSTDQLMHELRKRTRD